MFDLTTTFKCMGLDGNKTLRRGRMYSATGARIYNCFPLEVFELSGKLRQFNISKQPKHRVRHGTWDAEVEGV